MRTTKITEVIEEFDEQGRVVRRTTTTTEETENDTQTITTTPSWLYTTPCGSGGWATTTTTDINHTDAADCASTTVSGSWDGEVTLKG